jgi:flagellar basal body-associated protein FliL
MKTSLVLLTVFIVVLLSISLVLANSTMLPKHPGYPMGKAVDPVKGQSLANDPGQSNATGENSLNKAAAFDDVHVKQSLSINQNDQRLLEKPGAGVLPKVQGPNIRIEPPR